MALFKILNDMSADWAIQKIKEHEEERDRLLELVNIKKRDLEDQSEDIKAYCENETRFLKAALAEYFETIKPKETKTQKTYKLLSGTLVFKKPSIEYKRDDNALISWAKANGHEDVVETTEKLKWADFKRELAVVGDQVVIAETGEAVDGVVVEETEGRFEVK